MINQFKSLHPVNLVLLAIVAVVFRAGVWIKLPDSIGFSLLEPYTARMISLPANLLSPSANIFIATAIVFIQAVLLNRIVNVHNLLGKPTFIPALMYVTITAVLGPFTVLNPALIANFFVLWMLERFLSIYRRDNVLPLLFDLGMITAAGTLVYFPFIGMLPLLWVNLVIFRPFSWREWVAGLTGFITICFFVCTFYYLNDSLENFLHTVPLVSVFRTGFHINFYHYIVLIPPVITLFLSVFTLQKKFYRSSVHVRKSYFTLGFLLIAGLLSVYLKIEFSLYHFLLAVPAAAVFMAHFFVNAGKRWFYETMYILIAGFIIYFQLV